VVTGELSPGTKLPTVRQLAADLGLAVNTVARAYRELEADALVVTRGRRGTFVRSEVVDQGTTTSTVAETARAAAAEYVYTIRRLGLSSQEALRLAENAWSSS
jgi:DNA-binding transcriptional regulator YhcF (GntR family)